jgi:hypothetical protein
MIGSILVQSLSTHVIHVTPEADYTPRTDIKRLKAVMTLRVVDQVDLQSLAKLLNRKVARIFHDPVEEDHDTTGGCIKGRIDPERVAKHIQFIPS